MKERLILQQPHVEAGEYMVRQIELRNHFNNSGGPP